MDRVLEVVPGVVIDRASATRSRRPSWPAWRLAGTKATAAAAPSGRRVALAVVVVGLLTSGCASSTPPTTPAPTSTAVTTPSPTPSPTLSPTPSPIAVPALPSSGTLAAGTYRTDFGEGVVITFTLPDGWTSLGGGVVRNGDQPNGLAFTTWQIATVYADPCHWRTTADALGPTVDDLVTALAAQKRGATVTPTDVTIDGFAGKQVDLMVPLDVTFSAPSVASGCDGDQYKTWTDTSGGDRYNQGPGQHDLLDVLDLGGRTFVIQRTFYAANTTADLAELQAILDSTKITP